MPRLTLTLERELFETGSTPITGALQRRFFGAQSRVLVFASAVDVRTEIAVDAAAERVKVSWPDRADIRRGDQLVLDMEGTASPQDLGRVTILDGSAVFLKHFLSRCSPATIQRFPAELPDVIDERLDPWTSRDTIVQLRNEALLLMVTELLAGAPSVARLENALSRSECEVALLPDEGEAVPFRELYPKADGVKERQAIVKIMSTAQDLFGDIPSILVDGLMNLLERFETGRRARGADGR